MRSDLILRQLAKRHVGRQAMDDVFLTEVKNGRTWDNREPLRMDALAIRKSWAKPLVVGYEVKVSRSDFLQDTKWPKYMDLCHEFYFVCPNELIAADELPPTVGLIWYNPEKDCITTRRKAVYRPVDIPKDMLWYLVMTRTNSDRQHPFFSGKREFFEAWVEEKENKEKLGRVVGSKAFKFIQELQGQISYLELELKAANRDKKQFEAACQVAINHGATVWQAHNNLTLFLEDALKTTLPPKMAELVGNIERDASRLKSMVCEKVEA